MKAISIKQPWAHAILRLGKDVENRSRDFTGGYRGSIAVHASKTVDEGGFPALRHILGLDDMGVGRIAEQCQGTLGAIVGVADLVGVHRQDRARIQDEFVTRIDPRGMPCCLPWGMRDGYHLVLANPRPLPEPVPCRGALGLWTVPDDIAAKLPAVTP